MKFVPEHHTAATTTLDPTGYMAMCYLTVFIIVLVLVLIITFTTDVVYTTSSILLILLILFVLYLTILEEVKRNRHLFRYRSHL